MNIADAVQVFKALMESPASRLDLAKLTKCNPKTIGRLLNEMRAQEMIYVAAYSGQTDGRNRVKIYAFGQGEDAQPRSSQSQAARSRKSYVKKVQAQKAAKIKTTFVKGVPLWQ
jgi:DNA-binding transcriptional regulator YhcF (GntR family)